MQTILLKRYHNWGKKFLRDEDGATAIEYGLLAALIGGTVVSAQAALGGTVVSMYTDAIGIIIGAMGS
ncbi:MAG: Flp family type IVb pilin [Nitrospirota bacterium]